MRALTPRILRLACVLSVALPSSAALSAAAAAAPPVNDNYLSSIPINKRGDRLTRQEVKDLKDTREATTQSDLFSPMNGGGGAETTSCEGASFGKTVWYDFHPETQGTAELQAAGFDAVIAVYEFDPVSSRVGRAISCQNDPGLTEDLFVPVVKGRSYTVQIGGLGTNGSAAGGDLQFGFQFFADRDGDGVLDPLDSCPTQAGSTGQGGCPPELRSTPKLSATPTARGIKVRRLTVAAPRGARVSLRCLARCRLREARQAKTVSFQSLRGRELRAGAVVEIRVTKARSIGNVFRYRISRGNFKRTDLCLPPGAKTPRKRCK